MGKQLCLSLQRATMTPVICIMEKQLCLSLRRATMTPVISMARCLDEGNSLSTYWSWRTEEGLHSTHANKNDLLGPTVWPRPTCAGNPISDISILTVTNMTTIGISTISIGITLWCSISVTLINISAFNSIAFPSCIAVTFIGTIYVVARSHSVAVICIWTETFVDIWMDNGQHVL